MRKGEEQLSKELEKAMRRGRRADKPIDKNSMLYWWPKVKDLGIPMPKTVMVNVDSGGIEKVLENDFSEYHVHEEEIQNAVQEVGLPLFLRTDLTSGKHDWEQTCYYESGGGLLMHVYYLMDYCERADFIGLSTRALVFREYIPMESSFTAFSGQMPVNSERRYFVRDGETICHHPYWIAEAVEQGAPEGSLPENWRELLELVNTETPEEIELLTGYAETIGKVLKGYWSVDFCKAKDGRWVFIDAAEGLASWHPDCPYKE
jgi:hypothetical protein